MVARLDSKGLIAAPGGGTVAGMPRIELEAADGHTLSAHRADPDGEPRAGVVVVQEIFGVNSHIRSVADRYAEQGYLAIAPALFDRIEPGLELAYDDEGIARGRKLVEELGPAEVLADLRAAVEAASAGGKVAMVGYCYGGAVVWVAASEIEELACVSSYYGSRIPRFIDLVPRCPVMMHVGERDESFPMDEVEAVQRMHPSVIVHRYDAVHGFNCDQRGSYDAEASAKALERTLAFFAEHAG